MKVAIQPRCATHALWDGTSNGTRYTIDKALDRAVPVYVEVM